jgi:hypothetical protein
VTAIAARSVQGEGMGKYGAIVLEIKSRMEKFARIDLIFEGRSSNIDAQLIARSFVNLSVDRHVWFLEPSDCICNYVSLNE